MLDSASIQQRNNLCLLFNASWEQLKTMLRGKMKLLVIVIRKELGKISQDLEVEKSGKQVLGGSDCSGMEIAPQKE